MNDLLAQPLTAVAAALRQGKLSPQALYEQVQHNYDTTEPNLNVYKTWAPEQALAQAKAADAAFAAGLDLGLLQGIPVSVKDHFGVHQLPIFAGTARELPPKWQREGPMIKALRQQLAVLTGKAHAVELAFGGIGLNSHWGSPRNPWDAHEHRVCGGSSSGAGVSLWQGTAFIALGTDTGGSVRIPASMTGTVGFKTSFGRWSLDGIVPLSTTLDTPGILARSVADIVVGFNAIDPDPGPVVARRVADLRIGLAQGVMWDQCATSISQVAKAALDELAAQGAKLTDIPLPQADDAMNLLRSGSVVSAECDAFLEAELPEWRPLLDPIITMRIADGGAIPAREYVLRQQRIRELACAAEQVFIESDADIIVAPTVPISPPKLSEVSDLEGYRPRNAAALSNTCVGNFLDLCGISMPAGLDDQGLPVGLMLLARKRHEKHLLGVALAVEQVLGTALQRLGRPPLSPQS